MLPVELIILIVALVGNGFLALFTLSKNPNSHTNRLLFLFTLVIALYNLFNYLIPIQRNDGQTFFWLKMVMSTAAVINILFYFLVATFPKPKIQIGKIFLIAALLSTSILIMFAQSNLIFSGVVRSATNIDSTPAIGMPLFLLHTLIYLAGAFFILIRKIKRSVGVEKAQLKLFLVSTIFLFLSIMVTNLILPVVFKFTALITLLPGYTVIFIAMISYSIVRHKFLNINLLVTRSVAYVMLFSILGLLYSSGIFLISNYFYKTRIATGQAFIYVLLALFIGLTLQPLRKILEEVTDSIFFKGKYSSNDLVFRLTKIMASTLKLEDLIKETLHELLLTMRIDKGAVILFRENQELMVFNEGHDIAPKYDTETVGKLFSLKQISILEEEDNEEVKQYLQKLNIAIALPLFEDGRHEGILVLEEKKSGEVYSKQDIDVLKILGPEVSVAINNAESYEEISRFNITLREEVNKATSELKEANEKLIGLDKLKDEFVSLASHELRTPMTAVKSYLWMALKGDAGVLNDTQKLYLERAYSSVDRLIKLVNDMLNISRIESGRLTLQFQKIDAYKLVEEVIAEVQPRADELGVKVLLSPTSSHPMVLADSDKIKEVLFNLIGNSLKFTPRGGNISIVISQKNEMIELSIRDTGAGISSENISKLFQKFSMLRDSYTANKNASGTGLGLYICRSIIELHNGKIWVNSEGLGKGAQFTFTLKAFKEDDLKIASSDVNAKKTENIGIIHTQI